MQSQPHLRNSKWRGGAQGDGGIRNRRMMMMSGSPSVNVATAAVSQSQVPSSALPPQRTKKQRVRAGQDDISLDDEFVHCFLNVTPVMYAKDGYICVSVGSCMRAKNAATDVKNLYVFPQDLRMPRYVSPGHVVCIIVLRRAVY